jgi:hypothetical protein
LAIGAKKNKEARISVTGICLAYKIKEIKKMW